MSDTKITPREAAIAVLKKAEELYKASSLAKAEKPMKKDMPAPAATPAPAAGPSLDPDKVKAFSSGFNGALGKSDEKGANPDENADAALGEKVEQDVHAHEAQNADPAHEAPMKGHIKLAKFVGRMEHKRGQLAKTEDLNKKESDFDKLKNKIKAKEGYSEEAAAATAA